jgi:hypothetical protein
MQNFHSFVHSFYSLPDVSADRISRALVDKEFSPAAIITTMALHTHTHPPEERTTGPLVSMVLRCNSHPINMINQSINDQSEQKSCSILGVNFHIYHQPFLNAFFL